MWHGNEKHKEQLLQCQQHTERLGAMLSARSWEAMRVFSPLVRVFFCILCIKAVTGCFSCADCLRHVKFEGEGRNTTSNRVNVNSTHLFLVYLCRRVRQGERIKKPSTHQNKPSGLCCSCRVRPWTWHQSQSFSQPFALPLSNREFCIHKQKLDMAFINERHFVKAAHSWRDEEGPLLHWHQRVFGRSAQQNTAAKYIGLGACRATNTPTEAQATSSLLHSPTSKRYKQIHSLWLCITFLTAESTNWTTWLLQSC